MMVCPHTDKQAVPSCIDGLIAQHTVVSGIPELIAELSSRDDTPVERVKQCMLSTVAIKSVYIRNTDIDERLS